MAKAKSTKALAIKKPKAKEPFVEVDGVSEQLEPVVETQLPPPNVIWSSEKKEDGSFKFGNPPASPVRIGPDAIEVPDAETQLKGFYSPSARRLVRQINGYKFFQPKG